MTGKRRLAYLGVIGVGLGALIVDRLLSGRGPTPAAGAAPTALARPAPTAAPAQPPAVTARLLVSVLPFPRVPAELVSGAAARDPFVISGTALGALAPPPPAPEATAGEVATQAVASFADRHLFSGVVVVGDVRVAVVDGMSVEAGSQVDECIVGAIDARSITFLCPAGPVQLHLQSPIPDPGNGE